MHRKSYFNNTLEIGLKYEFQIVAIEVTNNFFSSIVDSSHTHIVMFSVIRILQHFMAHPKLNVCAIFTFMIEMIKITSTLKFFWMTDI